MGHTNQIGVFYNRKWNQNGAKIFVFQTNGDHKYKKFTYSLLYAPYYKDKINLQLFCPNIPYLTYSKKTDSGSFDSTNYNQC